MLYIVFLNTGYLGGGNLDLHYPFPLRCLIIEQQDDLQYNNNPLLKKKSIRF